ncbi:phytanoyl-CoA dioxygenase family protein [bacterium]|jgi:ectoine hydroxylase|nr:phytanoyl-CoA dioxygenase family protein [bacterium]
MPLLTPEERRSFEQDGFIVVPALLSLPEVNLLLSTARGDRSVEDGALQRSDGEGGITRLKVWNQEGDDVYGLVARSRRVVERMQTLLGDEVYFYHSKMMLKEPRTGGAWAWHQDYGYWYNNGCLWPDMGSCLIALEPATRENGCLQVLAGSHRVGRMDHGKVGDQTGADPERVDLLAQQLPLIYVEMKTGDAIFFHANLLHRSDQNRSEKSRWSYICCYNTKHNDPVKIHHHPNYHPLSIVEDSLITAMAHAER